jgi:hypothetical protein
VILSLPGIQFTFEPAAEVNLTYTRDTSGFTVVPGTPIPFYWQVADSATMGEDENVPGNY